MRATAIVVGAGIGAQAHSHSARASEDFHLPDGPEARARNVRMVAYAAENRFGPFSTAWAVEVT